MFIVKIKGGLGNQLFQYAIGLELSKINNSKLYLDISWYEKNNTDTPRNFMLNLFNISYEIASEDQIKKFINNNSLLHKILNRLNNIFLPIKFRKHIIELNNIFNEEILKLKNDFYLDGTWMNDKYFFTVEEEIKKLYSVRPILNKYYEQIEANIINNHSISVHIRRGDYANNPSTLKYHGLIPKEYYIKTINFLSQKFDNLNFYFFSDDIEWVKKEFVNIPNSTFVYSNDINKDIQEFYLMTKCKNNIIANSTYSWWAAWLNSNPNKVICAPQKWSSTIHDSKSILPEDWLKFDF